MGWGILIPASTLWGYVEPVAAGAYMELKKGLFSLKSLLSSRGIKVNFIIIPE